MTTSSLSAAQSLRVVSTTLMLLTPQVWGHTMNMKPVSRQYWMTLDFQNWDYEDLEYLPFTWNADGPDNVVARSKRETDPKILAPFVGQGDGVGGDYFPLSYLELADNGNFAETNEIAKRHGVCGTPRKNTEGDENDYSSAAGNWQEIPPGNAYKSGQVIEVDIQVEYYHAGHIEMRLCDTGDLPDPDGIADQECFNIHQLDRASDDGGASPIDDNHRGRYYIDPPCRKSENGPIPVTEMRHTPDAYQFTGRWVLPDIECKHCILQLHHLTGGRCRHIGYDDFNPPSWPSKCAPNKEDWIEMGGVICGDWPAYPEEFWQCSDISLTRDGSAPAPAPEPVPEEAPEDEKEDEPVAAPRETPEEPETDDADYTPETTTFATPDDSNDAFVYVGCFKDDKFDRVLEKKITTSNSMTAELCYNSCKGSIFMATQAGNECWCSDEDMLNHERHGEGDCNYACTGAKSERCGGFDMFDLYVLEEVAAEAECEGAEVSPYDQCGGDDEYDGPTCCTEGYECVNLAPCYSQCREM